MARYSAATDPLCHNGKQIPALYLLGAQSCGTTSFVAQLSYQHWGITPAMKEWHFFDRPERFKKGIGAYLNYWRAPACGAGVLALDATPNYMADRQAPERAKQFFTKAQLEKITFAVLLCDPARRAAHERRVLGQVVKGRHRRDRIPSRSSRANAH